MRIVGRLALRSLLALAWVAFAASLAMWVRSGSVSEEWTRPIIDEAGQARGTHGVLSVNGRLLFQVERADGPLPIAPPRGIHHGPGRFEGAWPFNDRGGAIARGGWGYDVRRETIWVDSNARAGPAFSVSKLRAIPARYTSVLAPWYGICAVAGAWPLAWTVRRLRSGRRRRRRIVAGLCVDCGYDLRATAHRGRDLLDECPECGRRTAAGAYART